MNVEFKTKRLITNEVNKINMGRLGPLGGFCAFIVGGIVAIVVGAFMLRGTMHLWDKNDSIPDNKKLKKSDD